MVHVGSGLGPHRGSHRGKYGAADATAHGGYPANIQHPKVRSTYAEYSNVRGPFSPNPSVFILRTCPARPIRAHTCPGITRRLCGWLGASGTQLFESSEALAELPARGSQAAVAHTRAVALHGCCARVSLAAALLSQLNILTAWPGQVGSAGTKSSSRARSLVLLTMLAPVVENRTFGGPATL